MTEEQAHKILLFEVKRLGGQTKCAKMWGISTAYMNDLVLKKRAISEYIALHLALKRVVRFEFITDQECTCHD